MEKPAGDELREWSKPIQKHSKIEKKEMRKKWEKENGTYDQNPVKNNSKCRLKVATVSLSE